MCTVTFLPRRSGYRLGMNRDEKLARVTALPPTRVLLGGREALYPSEPTGGTWVGVNHAGATLALINWYSAPARVAGQSLSRGEVVRVTLPSESAARVDSLLETLPLSCVNPFRLIGVFPTLKAVVEWRWDLARLERIAHQWRAHTWISSGFDERGAQESRAKVFREALQGRSAGRVDWLRRLHASHGPERGPYSTCMHREDAATVSYTEVAVSRQEAALSYTPGAPCCTRSLPALHLRLNPPEPCRPARGC